MFVNKMPRYEILSQDAMATLDRGWRRIVSELGIEFMKPEAVELFKAHGQRVEGDKVVTKVEAAWNESWVGGEQVRFLRFETDDLLHIVSAPMPHPNLPGRKVRVVVTWKREE